MNTPTLFTLLLACPLAFSACASPRLGAPNPRCVELHSYAGELVATGERSISITTIGQSEGARESAETTVIRAALDQWNALIPRVSVDEMQRLADSALPCVRYEYSALNLFVATVGLQSDKRSELARFARTWFSSEEAKSQPISSLGRAVLKERRGDRKGAEAEIRDGIVRDLNAVARRAGLLYLSGTFFAPDDALGASWVKQAADLGDWRAQRLMALLYTAGRGVPKDELAAERYVKLAGENPLSERNVADEAIISIRPLPPSR